MLIFNSDISTKHNLMVTIRIQEEGWTPLSITKSGWSVKTRPIYSYMRWTGAESVGSDIKWCNSDDIVSNSIWLPVWDVISTHHHALDLALKSPKSIEKWALLHFRTPPPYCYWWLSWKNAAESFTVALTLTLGGYESAIAPKNDYWWF